MFYPWMSALPEIFITVMLCITLLATVLSRRQFTAYYLAQLTLLLLMPLTFFCYDNTQGPAFFQSFQLDALAFYLKESIYLLSFFVFVYSRHYISDRQMAIGEFHVMGLVAILGMMIMVSGRNLLVLYLGLELMSLPTYAMVALYRNKAICVEAAMKYFLMGAVASGIFLYGLSLLFGVAQSLDVAVIATRIADVGFYHQGFLLLSLVFIMAGLVFKLGAVPFHMWVPDVYEGAPTAVTLFISGVPKIAAFGFIIRLIPDMLPTLHLGWQEIWTGVALLSMALGNLAAIVQTNIKRMLAYSSIAHMGYMILGLITNTPGGEAASMFYVIAYAVMTTAGFGMVALMSQAGIETDHIDDLAGLNTRNPWLAFMMLLVMFSMAGIPPLLGFMAKVGLLEALISVHQVWLAVVTLLFAIIGSYYYIRVVKVMYFEEPVHQAVVYPGPALQFAISVNGVAVLLLGIFPGFLFHICRSVFV